MPITRARVIPSYQNYVYRFTATGWTTALGFSAGGGSISNAQAYATDVPRKLESMKSVLSHDNNNTGGFSLYSAAQFPVWQWLAGRIGRGWISMRETILGEMTQLGALATGPRSMWGFIPAYVATDVFGIGWKTDDQITSAESPKAMRWTPNIIAPGPVLKWAGVAHGEDGTHTKGDGLAHTLEVALGWRFGQTFVEWRFDGVLTNRLSGAALTALLGATNWHPADCQYEPGITGWADSFGQGGAPATKFNYWRGMDGQGIQVLYWPDSAPGIP